MRRSSLFLAPFVALVVAAPACSQTPTVVPARSMERPKDVDFICLEQLDDVTWRGAPLGKCAYSNVTGNPVNGNPDGSAPSYHLHAVVTQVSRGELAVADLGIRPTDQGATLVKADPRIAGFNFIPVGAVPADVAADPNGHAVYVASAHDLRIDVIPAELLRGPIDTDISSGYSPLPWPHVDLDPTSDGAPVRMAVVNERLYVALPNASGGAKIAVYDLASDPLLPVRLSDVQLNLSSASPLSVSSLACDANGSPPWWTAYDECFGVQWKPKIPTIDPTIPAGATLHVSSFAVAGNLLFASDDSAPFIHVFDVTNPTGVEIRRIATGARLSNLSISDAVPDEVTFTNPTGTNATTNFTSIDICETQGWIGDGLDHSDAVPDLPGGQCRAHRYIYAVDLDDPPNADGSIEIIDVPVHYALNAAGTAIARNADGQPEQELIDLPSAQLALPLACDAPSFPATRLTLGPNGIGGAAAVPVKAVAFMRYDPPSGALPDGSSGITGARCRPQNVVGGAGGSKATAEVWWGNQIAGDNTSWITRLRGEFGFVVLDNGSLEVIDVDDWDAMCRGPRDTGAEYLDFFSGPQSQSPAFAPLDTSGHKSTGASGLGNGSSEEWLGRPVRRNHPRSFRLYDVSNEPSVSDAVLTTPTITTGGATTPSTTGANGSNVLPHLVSLVGASNTPATSTSGTLLPSADNPYEMVSETWTATYQGSLPGFVAGSAGSLLLTSGELVDPAGNFCNRGVEAFGGDVATHDVVQILDDVCYGPGDPNHFGAQCDQPTHDECVNYFGLSTDVPLPQTRDFVIDQAFNDHVTLASGFVRNNDGTLSSASLDAVSKEFEKCFCGSSSTCPLLRYTVRAGNTWVVVGTLSGFLHRVIPASSDPSAACIIDSDRSMLEEGRAREIPPPGKGKTQAPLDGRKPPDLCSLFVNPSWEFAIQQGYDDQGNVVPSTRDMRFTFSAHFAFEPYAVTIGSLPTAVRPVQFLQNGVDVLQWGQIATVDAINNGLQIQHVDDLNNAIGGQFHEFQ